MMMMMMMRTSNAQFLTCTVFGCTGAYALTLLANSWLASTLQDAEDFA